MAFGGVATGSIKAQLAAISRAAVTNKGSKFDCKARAGFLLNLVGIVLVSIVAVFLVPAILL